MNLHREQVTEEQDLKLLQSCVMRSLGTDWIDSLSTLECESPVREGGNTRPCGHKGRELGRFCIGASPPKAWGESSGHERTALPELTVAVFLTVVAAGDLWCDISLSVSHSTSSGFNCEKWQIPVKFELCIETPQLLSPEKFLQCMNKELRFLTLN